MGLIIDTQKPAFGLDISDVSMKAMLLQKKKSEVSPRAWADLKIPPGVIENDEIKDKKFLVQSIKNLIQNTKGGPIKTKRVIASVPESKSFVRIINLPPMEDEEIKEAISWEVEEHIPVDIENVYLDWQKIEVGKKPKSVWLEGKENINQTKILVVATPKKIIDDLAEVLKKADLIPQILEIESAAATRALIPKEDFGPYLIIDIDAYRTSFIIINKQILQLTTSIPIAGNAFTDAIARRLGIDDQEAEQLKRKHGLDKKKKRGRIYQALAPSLSNLTEEVNRLIKFYQEYFPVKNKISKVILCGGSAKLPGIASCLTHTLKLDVKLGNPWANIYKTKGRIPPISYKNSLSYTTAIGLALRGIVNK